MRSKRIIAPALLFVLFATLLIQLPMAIADRASIYEWFSEIQDIRYILSRDYVKEPDQKKMHDAMIRAMIDVLEDPYTQYVPPRDTAEFNKQLRGTYAGIGAEVNIVDGYLTISTPMDGSPALRAGVMAGDVVLEIEGESTFEVPIEGCVEKLTGEPGTPVTIKVRHIDDTEEVLEIVRAHIVTPTVKGLRRLGETWSHCVDETLSIAYVRVTQFNASTVIELREVLDEQTANGLAGLVLDLRDNPGGGLPAAVSMADMFLDHGVIVSVKQREGKGDAIVSRARAGGTLPDFPMVVLVNGQSASASEIVSGALQENGRAKILGTRTFGKGSVQEVRELKYGEGTLKFTTAYYYLPSGRSLNKSPDAESWGVDPDAGFVVPVSDDDYIQYFRARRNFEIIRAPDEDAAPCVNSDWIRKTLLDEQLAAAVDAVRERIAEGNWPALSEEDSATVAIGQELQRAARARTRAIERLRTIEDRIVELHGHSETIGREPILPADTDLTNGTIAIRDAAGTLVAEFRIEGGDVALALDAIILERVGDSDP